jgi:hypothetical protein
VLTVKKRGQSIATFRFIEVNLMETLAAWVPTTPEMEAKILFGEHIWDCAQHADALGKRTHELRMPLQHSIAPVPDYLAILTRLKTTGPTTERIAGFYDVLLPNLGARYRQFLQQTDGLMDAPSVRIIDRILSDHDRMIAQSRELLEELPALRLDDARWTGHFAADERAIAGIVATDPEAAGMEARP